MITGKAIIESRLPEILSKILQGTGTGLEAAGNEIIQKAANNAPKDTGALSRSGKSERLSPLEVEVSMGNDLPDERAVAQEFGTVFQSAQPYFYPAVNDTDVEGIIEAHIRKAL